MRFRKQEKVEVMNNKDGLVSWHVAEILCCSGHTYHVQYDCYPGMANDQMVEVVSREFVRPLPPPVQGLENFVAGDIVEVFYENSWKIAAILKIVGGKRENKRSKISLQAVACQNWYLVRLLGSSRELVIDRLNIRMRQTWHDGKWILIGKSSQAGSDLISRKQLTSNHGRKMNYLMPRFNARAKYHPRKGRMDIQDDAALWESPARTSRSRKRISSCASSIIEAQNGCAQKFRAIEKGQKQRVVVAPLLEKVDAVGYPEEILGKKNMHTSFNVISNGYNQTKRAKQNDVLGYTVVRSSELNTSSDSDACSVGSCSVTYQTPKNCSSHFIHAHCKETDTLCSDAESSCGSGSERESSSLPPKEELEVSVRRLELHAYRSTLGALYASGPLSWEQEALLTNLRFMLHISNDEHLKELKHLISTKTAIGVR